MHCSSLYFLLLPVFRRQADGGSWFYGGWRRGKRHGAGVELVKHSGARFEGVWRDGCRDNTLSDKEVLPLNMSVWFQSVCF